MRWHNLACATLLSSLTILLTTNNHHLNQEAQAIEAMNNLYIIGDSLSDNGALVGAGTQFFKDNWLFPNIKAVTMEEPYHHNQFCNGPNAVSIVAQYFHKTLTPGWKFKKIPFVGKTYQQVGNNYAIAAARTGTSIFNDSFFVNKFSAQKQVDALFSQHQTINDHDWLLFIMGANDLLATMLKQTFPLPWELYLQTAINNEKATLLQLINHHVAHIVVSDAPDISKTPAFSKDPSLKLKAATVFNYYHYQWKMMINDLKQHYQQQINEFDLSTIINETLIDLSKQGINIKDAASNINFYEAFAKDGNIHPQLNPGITLDTVNNYFFVDDVHPTATASKVIGMKLAHFITNIIKQNLVI